MRRRLRRNTSAMMAMRTTAAPPMATPAIPPVLNAFEPPAGAADDADALEEVDEGLDVADAVAVVTTVLGVFEDEPAFAVKLTYAPQSLTGAASGHVGFWHRLSSCGPLAGLNVIAGAQRTLYREFNRVLKVAPSCSEKPKC